MQFDKFQQFLSLIHVIIINHCLPIINHCLSITLFYWIAVIAIFIFDRNTILIVGGFVVFVIVVGKITIFIVIINIGIITDWVLIL